MSASRELFGKVADDEGDGEPDADHVGEDGDNVRGKREWVAMRRGVRDDDPIHDNVNRDAVGDTPGNWLPYEECELAAGEIKNSGRGKCD